MVLSQAKGMSFFFFKSNKAPTVNDALFPKKKLYLDLISISRVNNMETLLQIMFLGNNMLFLVIIIISMCICKIYICIYLCMHTCMYVKARGQH